MQVNNRRKSTFIWITSIQHQLFFHPTSFHISPNTKSQCQGENYPILNFLSGSRESKTHSVLKIPRGLQGLFKRRADGVSSPQPFLPFPSFIKTLSPHQLGVREPGLRDEPHRFGIRLESRSVKWKPNSLSFLYITVSSTQIGTVFPAREEEEISLSPWLHHLKPSDGLDSCCLLIMGQTSQREARCISRSRNNPAIVWGKLGHLGLSFHVN